LDFHRYTRFTSKEREPTEDTRELGRNGRRTSKARRGFAEAIVKNNPEAIERFATDDWTIINADGGIIDEQRFIEVIKSGALSHEMMESDHMRVRVYGNSDVVSALTRSKGKFMQQELTAHERSTDVFVRRDGHFLRWALTQLTGFTKK
jgi:Domain of unknown function (DUF4440)